MNKETNNIQFVKYDKYGKICMLYFNLINFCIVTDLIYQNVVLLKRNKFTSNDKYDVVFLITSNF